MPEHEARRWSRRSRRARNDRLSPEGADLDSADRPIMSGFDVDIVIGEQHPAETGAKDPSGDFLESDDPIFGDVPPGEDFPDRHGPVRPDRSVAPTGNVARQGAAPLPQLAPLPQPASMPIPVAVVVGSVRVPQIVVGSASPEEEPRPIADSFRSRPETVVIRPDTVVDGWSSEYATVRGASLRGHLHRHNGAPRQDDFVIHLMPDGRVIAVVADGVSAAPHAHLGASTAVQFATRWLHNYVPEETSQTDWRGLLKSTAWALAERAQELLKLESPDPGKAEQELATTVICAVIEMVDPGLLRAFIVGVGDSGAWLLRNGEFRSVLGGKTAGEGGISSSAVVPLPRVPIEITATTVEFDFDDVLMIGTDGIGDPLGSGQGGVGNLFRELFSGDNPPSLFEFGRAVDFSRETFDDDRTLVAVMPRRPPHGEG